MTTVFHARLGGRFKKISKCKLRRTKYKTNQNSNLRTGSFSNSDNAESPIHIKREREFKFLKRRFFIKDKTIHFRSNRTRVIWTNRWNNSSFPYTKSNKQLPTPKHNTSKVRLKFRIHLKIFPSVESTIKFWVEDCIISKNTNIRVNIIMKITDI